MTIDYLNQLEHKKGPKSHVNQKRNEGMGDRLDGFKSIVKSSELIRDQNGNLMTPLDDLIEPDYIKTRSMWDIHIWSN